MSEMESHGSMQSILSTVHLSNARTDVDSKDIVRRLHQISVFFTSTQEQSIPADSWIPSKVSVPKKYKKYKINATSKMGTASPARPPPSSPLLQVVLPLVILARHIVFALSFPFMFVCVCVYLISGWCRATSEACTEREMTDRWK